MKTQLILKTAVVAMAAFGAYAFNSTNNNTYRVDEGLGCRNVEVACADQGNFMCQVKTEKGIFQVWSDLSCAVSVSHTSPKELPEIK